MDGLILCGGLGTRLKPVVPDRPKGLATVSGRPFLDILVEELVRQGLQRLILCTGHGSRQIIDHFRRREDAEFVFSTEEKPLGTGGAVRNALPHVHSNPFIVVNGDSFCRVAYADLLAFHAKKAAGASVVVSPPSERTDTGIVQIAEDNRLLSFTEKPVSKNGSAQIVNAGIYVLERQLIDSAPKRPLFSLERDVIPRAVEQGLCYGFRVKGPMVDIGTPERYEAAQRLLR